MSTDHPDTGHSDVPATWPGGSGTARIRFGAGPTCTVEVDVEPDRHASGTGPDLFEALVAARLRLEADGVTLACNGARRDVYPSPMLRQAAHGRRAYELALPRTAGKPPVVDIFAAAPPTANLGTVAEQRDWFHEWTRSPPVPDE